MGLSSFHARNLLPNSDTQSISWGSDALRGAVCPITKHALIFNLVISNIKDWQDKSGKNPSNWSFVSLQESFLYVGAFHDLSGPIC